MQFFSSPGGAPPRSPCVTHGYLGQGLQSTDQDGKVARTAAEPVAAPSAGVPLAMDEARHLSRGMRPTGARGTDDLGH